ncbi:MAG: GerMN domain-containing protein [Deltaproteobacteria bacterium]|nr:GerMN domain-containing protein [Deltaproteobacteria bacterium]
MPRKTPQKSPVSRKRKTGYLPILIGAAVALIIGLFLISRRGDVIFRTAGRPAAEEKEIAVYFSSVDGLGLQAEKIRIKKGTVEEELNAALALLVKGPNEKGLGKTLPDETKINGLKIKGHTVIVDFSPEISANHAGGSSGEIQTVYSIVNTVALNFPQFKDVQLLVDGKKAETLAGHIDITRPLSPDVKVIKK